MLWNKLIVESSEVLRSAWRKISCVCAIANLTRAYWDTAKDSWKLCSSCRCYGKPEEVDWWQYFQIRKPDRSPKDSFHSEVTRLL
jgi:hypothetical protein